MPEGCFDLVAVLSAAYGCCNCIFLVLQAESPGKCSLTMPAEPAVATQHMGGTSMITGYVAVTHVTEIESCMPHTIVVSLASHNVDHYMHDADQILWY